MLDSSCLTQDIRVKGRPIPAAEDTVVTPQGARPALDVLSTTAALKAHADDPDKTFAIG